MALVWIVERETGEWAARPLSGEALRLGERGVEPVPVDAAEPLGPVLRRYGAGPAGRPRWALLAEPGRKVRANGEAVETGIRVLRNRDLLTLAGQQFVFSTEELPFAEPVPEDRIGTRCARCTRAFVSGEVVVLCPRCGTAHHAMETLACWSYRPRCATCDASTSGEEYAWTPDSL